MSFSFTIELSACLNNSFLKWGLLRGGTYVWRSVIMGQELLDIDLGIWCDKTSGLHTVMLMLM
jgi:hypothetical protein